MPLALPRALRQDRRRIVGALLLVLLVAVVMLWRSEPIVPRQLTILAGSEGTSEYTDALRYATALARHGVRAEVVETAGSAESVPRHPLAPYFELRPNVFGTRERVRASVERASSP